VAGPSIVSIAVLTCMESTAPDGLAQSCASGQSEDGRGIGVVDDECGAVPWLSAPGIAISHVGCVVSDWCRHVAAAAKGRNCKSSSRVAMERTMLQRYPGDQSIAT